MAWQEPKTNWTAADGVRNTDLNRIEGNTLALRQSGGAMANIIIYVNGTTGSDATGTGASNAPYGTIMFALSTVPKNLNGYSATINIAAGTYNENVTIADFTGQITLTGTSGSIIGITSLTVSNAFVYAYSITFEFSATANCLTVSNEGMFHTIGNVRASSGTIGIRCTNRSCCIIKNTLTSNGSSGTAISLVERSSAFINRIEGSGRANGTYVAEGSSLAYSTATLSATGVLHTTVTGGRIYAGAQASIPNY